MDNPIKMDDLGPTPTFGNNRIVFSNIFQALSLLGEIMTQSDLYFSI